MLLLLIFIIITSFLLLIYSTLMIHYRKCWNKLPVFVSNTTSASELPFISVVISVRNEAANIPALLESLFRQSYPADLFEIILIDDHSTDDTAEIIRSYTDQRMRLLDLSRYLPAGFSNSFKKKAISVGVMQARGTLIVTTDADCLFHKSWLSTIGSCYSQHPVQMMVMPVLMNSGWKPFSLFQSLDFMTLQGITGAAAGHKLHSMCNGANLAYTKKGFESVNGFEGVEEIASGDDMLLMQKFREKFPNQIAYLKSEKVIVTTQPQSNWIGFFRQRIRWASKARKYKDSSLFPVLLLVYLLNLCLLIFGIITFAHSGKLFKAYLDMLLIFFMIKTVVEWYFLLPVSGFFKKSGWLWLFPFFQPFHVIYTVIAGLLGNVGKYTWKGRKVN